jgi:hypothetical protein
LVTIKTFWSTKNKKYTSLYEDEGTGLNRENLNLKLFKQFSTGQEKIVLPTGRKINIGTISGKRARQPGEKWDHPK